MANKEASEPFGKLKNNNSEWIKNKEKLLAALQKTLSSCTNKIFVAVITQNLAKPYSNGLFVHKGTSLQGNV